MSGESEKIIYQIREKIFRKVQNNITTLQKINRLKQPYSAFKVLDILEQVNDQLSYHAQSQNKLNSPNDRSKVQIDNFMSVYNIIKQEQRHKHLAHNKHSKAKKQSAKEQQEGQKKNKKIIFNKIQQLFKQAKKQQTFQQKIQNALRQKVEKQRLMTLQLQKNAKIKKTVKKQQIKQKFGYDYDCNRIKLQFQPKKNLVNSSKSLQAEVSTYITKKQSPYKIITQKTSVQTRPIEQKKKPILNKSIRIRTLPNQVQQKKQQKIQFSKIRTLTQRFDCQPGIVLQFENQYLNNNRKVIDLNVKQIKKPLRLSKLEYIMLKQRAKSSIDHIKQRSKINVQQKDQKQVSQISNNKRAYSTNLFMTIQSGVSTYRNKTSIGKKQQKKSKIDIPNRTMHQYLIASERTQISQKQKESYKQKISKQQSEQLETKSEIVLDDNDKFNIKYIKGLISNKTQNNTQRQMLSTSALTRERNYFTKVREKIQKKRNAMLEFKKKFQQTLRSNQHQFLTS